MMTLFSVCRRFTAPAALSSLAACALALGGCLSPPNGKVGQVKGISTKPIRNRDEAASAFSHVNQERMERGLLPLTRRADLDEVAYAHARDLAAMRKLSHVSSDGRQLENRLDKLDWIWAGENLARNKGFESPSREAIEGWIDSPRHRDNMFRPDFTQTGLAALYDPSDGFTYLVQVFIIPSEGV